MPECGITEHTWQPNGADSFSCATCGVTVLSEDGSPPVGKGDPVQECRPCPDWEPHPAHRVDGYRAACPGVRHPVRA